VEHFTRLDRNFGGLSGSLGMAWNPNDQVTVKANIGRGYRAPVVAELTADGVHPGSGLFQSGSSNLKPEFNLQGDLGLFYRGTHVTASAELFHDHVSNYIYNGRLVAANGGDSLVMQGGQALPVFRYAQTTAQLQGGDLSLDIHPHPWDRLHFENTLSFVFARNLGGHGVAITDSTRYLPLIPPLRLNSELRYAFSKPVGRFANLFVKFGVQVVAAQDRFYAAYGTESRTPGYALLEAGAGADVIGAKGNTLFTVTMLGTNLADLAYQNNMSRLKYMEEFPANGTGRSGIYEMGRNVTLTLSVPFDLKPKAVPPGG
jgi:iron complex outermembrane receptor protein